jgi:hypothetical protein
VAGAIVYGAWLAAAVWLLWRSAGRPAAVAAAIALPLFAIVALFAIERQSAVIDAVRAWFLLRRTHADTRKRLKRYRSDLADVLDEVHAWLSHEKVTG